MTTQNRLRQTLLIVSLSCLPSSSLFAQTKPVKRSTIDIKSTNLNYIATSTKWNDQIVPQNYNEFLNYPIDLASESVDEAVSQLSISLKKYFDEKTSTLLPKNAMHHLVKPIYLMSDSSIVFHVTDPVVAKSLLSRPCITQEIHI